MQNRALLKLICSISYFYSFNLYLMSMQLQLIKLPCNLQLQNSLQLITGTRIKVLTEQVEDFQATFAHSFPFTPANPIRCFVMSHSEHVIPLFLHHPVLWALTWSLSPLTSLFQWEQGDFYQGASTQHHHHHHCTFAALKTNVSR